MEIPNLEHLITKHHLTEAATEIRALACQSIRLLATPATNSLAAAGSLKSGGSRLGGQPDLPQGYKWPARQEQPMSFIAQICLEDIAGFLPAGDLPSSGTLSFFYDASQEADGASPEDRGGWEVAFFEPAAPLEMKPFPDSLPQAVRFSPLSLQFHGEWTLPNDPEQVMPGLEWSEQVQRAYKALLSEFRGPGYRRIPLHRMFGWPDSNQDDMQLQAAMMSKGFTSLDDPRLEDIAQNKAEWQLLLQVGSDERAGMRWGSNGMIFNWITGQALKERRFNQTWMILRSS